MQIYIHLDMYIYRYMYSSRYLHIYICIHTHDLYIYILWIYIYIRMYTHKHVYMLVAHFPMRFASCAPYESSCRCQCCQNIWKKAWDLTALTSVARNAWERSRSQCCQEHMGKKPVSVLPGTLLKQFGLDSSPPVLPGAHGKEAGLSVARNTCETAWDLTALPSVARNTWERSCTPCEHH
jgi:hypothetical protein